jgi:hypothetical protein
MDSRGSKEQLTNRAFERGWLKGQPAGRISALCAVRCANRNEVADPRLLRIMQFNRWVIRVSLHKS